MLIQPLRSAQIPGSNDGNESANRGTAAPLGAILLVGITVVLAAAVGTTAIGMGASPPATATPTAFSLSVTGDRVTLVPESGPPLDVRELRLRITVDGTPLAEQPPVPFFSANGFRSGPTGPFNPATDPTWTVGEPASFRVAGTNAPTLSTGVPIEIRIYRGEAPIAVVSTRVE